MSDVSRLIHSFPPRDRRALSDVAYDRQMREYVAVVEGLSAEGLMSGGGVGADGKRRDVLEVCVFFSCQEVSGCLGYVYISR